MQVSPRLWFRACGHLDVLKPTKRTTTPRSSHPALKLTSKLSTLLGASALLIPYCLAAALYYPVGVAEFYNGHVKTAEAFAALAGIGYWALGIATPVIFAVLLLDK